MSLHILPTWRTVPLAKITFEDLSEWVAHLSAGDLGPSGIRQSVFVMSAALDHAERSGRIRANPARGLGLPRVQRRDYIFLTHEQLHELSSAAGSADPPTPAPVVSSAELVPRGQSGFARAPAIRRASTSRKRRSARRRVRPAAVSSYRRPAASR